MSIVVSDTTPLNYLILIGNIDVLPRLFGRVLVPPAVIAELKHPKAPMPVSIWAHDLPTWIEVKPPKESLQLKLGLGEREAIALALELGNAAVLADDHEAVVAAQHRGLLAFRTLAILDMGDARGLLDFEVALSRLRETTFHIDNAVLERVSAVVRARKQP